MQQANGDEFSHPQGFLSLAKNVGIKDSSLDLAVIYSTVRARAAAVFTRNRFPGAPVIVGRKHIAKGFVQALVVNSKNANVAIGNQGIDDAIETCRIVGEELSINPYEVLPFSTGVIGRPLPMDKIRAGLRGIQSELRPDNLKLAAEAIMTTDTSPKYYSCWVGRAVIAGVAKGAGMIEPNMATMLVYLMTDAELPKAALRPLLRRVVDRTFNCVSIDTDTSTSDTVVLMANGLAGTVKLGAFEKALLGVCEHLTREIARGGEGATKLITVDVSRAKTDIQAKRVAKCVVNSPLVKTAIAGEDANWGRVVMAVGKAGEPADRDKLSIWFNGIRVAHRGARDPAYDEGQVSQAMKSPVIALKVALGLGRGADRVLTCDLTKEYVAINGDYRS